MKADRNALLPRLVAVATLIVAALAGPAGAAAQGTAAVVPSPSASAPVTVAVPVVAPPPPGAPAPAGPTAAEADRVLKVAAELLTSEDHTVHTVETVFTWAAGLFGFIVALVTACAAFFGMRTYGEIRRALTRVTAVQDKVDRAHTKLDSLIEAATLLAQKTSDIEAKKGALRQNQDPAAFDRLLASSLADLEEAEEFATQLDSARMLNWVYSERAVAYFFARRYVEARHHAQRACDTNVKGRYDRPFNLACVLARLANEQELAKQKLTGEHALATQENPAGNEPRQSPAEKARATEAYQVAVEQLDRDREALVVEGLEHIAEALDLARATGGIKFANCRAEILADDDLIMLGKARVAEVIRKSGPATPNAAPPGAAPAKP